jgi:hypothetical protein
VRELKVLVLGEGPHEIGRKLDQVLSNDELPALPILVRRILGDGRSVSFECRSFKNETKARVKDMVTTRVGARAGAISRKVAQAIQMAKRQFDAVVVVIDRDRKLDSEKIAALREGRNSAATKPRCPTCAVGTPVETFDAWMIADSKAVQKAEGNPDHCHPTPEGLAGKEGSGNHPKDRAAKVFGSSDRLGEKYRMVAEEVDLKQLQNSCPEGFKPFADEIRSRIAPLFTN